MSPANDYALRIRGTIDLKRTVKRLIALIEIGARNSAAAPSRRQQRNGRLVQGILILCMYSTGTAAKAPSTHQLDQFASRPPKAATGPATEPSAPTGRDTIVAASAEAPGSSSAWTLFPTDELYPRNLADPRRTTFSIGVANFSDSEIPSSGDQRFIIRLGGLYPIVRRESNGGATAFQIDAAAGFYGQFDIDEGLDILGWDGLYGLLFTWRRPNDWAYKLAILHDSAHIGDEYTQRVGRGRVNYTREEIVLGLSKAWGRRRGYFEIGWAYTEKAQGPFQEPLRAQLGAELESAPRWFRERVSWFAAVDTSLREERDWSPDVTAQWGVVLHQDARDFRAGLELRHGGSALGEFFFRDENHVLLAWWIDL